MKPPFIVLAVLCLAAAVPARAEIYRCGPPGQQTYTDRPCADGQRLELPPPVTVAPADAGAARDWDRRVARGRKARDAADAEWLEQHEERRRREERIRAARIAGRVVEGMTEAEVRHVLGAPDEVERGGEAEVWRYGSGRRIRFRDGVVVGTGKAQSRRKKG